MACEQCKTLRKALIELADDVQGAIDLLNRVTPGNVAHKANNAKFLLAGIIKQAKKAAKRK